MIHMINEITSGVDKNTIHWFLAFSQELLISAVGGFVGGALAYGWYIERKETRKNEAAKKSACTKALLTTQMVLLFQIQELKDLQKICQCILDFEFGAAKLGELLKGADTLAVTQMLDHIGKGGKSHEIFRATQFIIQKPSSNHIINLPHDIFDIRELNLESDITSQPELNHYFRQLTDCNRGYVKIISLLERHNETRDMVFNQLVSTPEIIAIRHTVDTDKLKFLCTIVAMTKISIDLLEKTTPVLKEMRDAFEKTGRYINAIGLSESIHPN
ncbi:MAG: hypothetical protein Q8L78_01600 [Coxiellaceae bacterium]|nr:hypothetical protein [Coxiellaceae bacterium]